MTIISGWAARSSSTPAVSLWYDEGRTFSTRSYPAPIFDAANVILVLLRIPRQST